MRRLLISTMLFSLLVPMHASGLPAQPRKLPRLGAVNVFRFSESTTMLVHFSRPLTIDLDEQTVIRGRGRYVGLAIASAEFKHVPDVVQLIGRFGGCRARACKPTEDSVQDSFPGGISELPAGDYRIYLIADGAPAKITLRIDSLQGRRGFVPTAPAAVKIQGPKPIFPLGDQSYFTVGASYKPPARRRVLLAQFVWARTSANGAVIRHCGYNGERVDPSEGYSPTYCQQNDDENGRNILLPPAMQESIRYYALLTNNGAFPELMSRGHWFKTNAPIERSGATHVFISY